MEMRSKRKLRVDFTEIPFDQVIEKMKERPCYANIRGYKNELKKLRIQSGCIQSTISHSQLNKQRVELAKRLNVNNFLAVKHRLLNTYIHNYRDKLCLT